MNISAESYAHAVVLNLQGELTEDSITAFMRVVDHQLEEEGVLDVAMNMENVPFVDSAALECILDLQDRLSERFGQVKLIKPDENVRKILEITRLTSTFEIHDNIAEAVKAVRA